MARTRRDETLDPAIGHRRLGDDPERLAARVIVHGAHDLGHQNLLAPRADVVAGVAGVPG